MHCHCDRKQSARKLWVVSFLIMIASRVTGLSSPPAAKDFYTHRSAHVALPAPAARCRHSLGARHQGTCTYLGVRRRTSNALGNRAHCCVEIRLKMNAGAEGDKEQGRRAGGGPRPKKRPLGLLSTGVNDAILEMCVENKGRPLARALTDFVEYTIEALASGYAVEALLLELQLLDSTTRVPGQTLTGVEKRYRTQWITAMHAVMQHLDYVERQEPKSAEEFHIKSQVDVVLRGRQTNDEQTFVKFDKALATGGVAGGVATERIVISPQMVPISQLTLLAIRALQKLEDAAAS